MKRRKVTKTKKKNFPVSYDGWEASAESVMEPGAFSYIHSPAGEGLAALANNEAFYNWRLVPRVLTNVSKRDLSVSLFGSRLPAPILLAPVGNQKRYHPDGELASARAAAFNGIPFILSTVASTSIEDVASAMGNSTRWFQLYPMNDLDVMGSMLKRARASGYSAIVVTVDRGGYPQYQLKRGYEIRGLRNYISDPIFSGRTEKMLGKNAANDLFRKIHNPYGFTWADLEFVKKESKLPVLLKGIVHPDDAETALSYNVDGIIVSNHGARHQDGVIGTMDALPTILDVVRGRIPVMLDSGIRGGVYVVKALALGAAAVDFGHLYAYALAVAGEAGVDEVIRNIISEIDKAVAYCGCSSIGELGRSMINRYS